MTSCLAGVAVSGFLLGAFFLSTALGQERSKVAEKQNPKRESVHVEIGKAPEKARARRNPMEKDPEAAEAGRILYRQHCAECTVMLGKAAGERRDCVPVNSKCGTRSDFLDPDKWCGPKRNASVVETARAAALADRELHQIAPPCCG